KQIQSFQQQLSGTIAMLELEQHERGADVGLDRQLQAMTGTIAGTIDRNGDGQAAQAQPGEQGLANTEAQAEPSPPEQAEDETETPAAQEGSQDEQLVAQNQSQTGGSSGAGQGDSSNGEDNENTIEGEGLSSQLADQSAEPDTTQAAANTAPVASEQNSGLWGWLISLGLALLLAIVAMFDWKRSGSILRGRFQKQQTQEDEDLFFTEPLRPKPVVRVRQRDTEGGSDSDEGQVPGPELQIPLADPTSTSGPAQQAEAGESLPDATIPGHGPMEPLVTGIAHWNRKDIPMLDVEEAEVGDLPPDDGRLSFDDFGLMNPISIEDLEIDAGDELGENFELDIDEEEEQRNR
ncbi:MAG: hypothetical protein OIF38_10645, partial [Cellvibrionaceae bacterium]|nr:hypothetical protein [Cellvibrionaceae bacterium]